MPTKSEKCERCVHLHSGQIEVCTAPMPCQDGDQFCSIGTLWDRMRAAEALADRLATFLDSSVALCCEGCDGERDRLLSDWRMARGKEGEG